MKRKQRRKAVSFLGGLLAACALVLALGNQEEAGRGEEENLAGSKASLSYGELTVSRNAPRFVAAPEDYQNIAISQVSDYVNIRSAPTTSGTIVGKIYNNCAATILQSVQGEGGVWYQIQSGSVNGYIKAQYFITGAQAEAIAKEIGVQYATVDTASLRLREQPSLSSAILTTLPQGAEYVVLGESNHFAHLSVDEDLTGYVSMDYIKTRIAFKQAVSLEEEAAKLAEEAKRKAEAAAAIQNLEEIRMVEAQSGAVNHASQQGGNPGGLQLQNGIPAASSEGASGGGSSGGIWSGGSIFEGSASGGNVFGGSSSGGNGSSGNTQSQDGMPIIAANPLGQGNDLRVSAPALGPVSSGSGSGGVSPGSGDNSGNPGGSGNVADPSGEGAQGQASSPQGAGGVTYGPGGNASSAVISATRTALVAYAKQFLGNPYVYGGSSLTEGTDCSGFVMRIYEHFGIQTGRNSREQAANGRSIAIEAVQPGDLLFYASGNTINHVAIYIGGGQVIHAASAKTGIIISPSNYRTPCKAVTFLQ